MEEKDKRIPTQIAIPIILVWIIFCFFADSVISSHDNLIITEIMYSPENSDDKREWIEIYNSSEDTIFISKSKLGLIDEKEERHENGTLKNTCHTFDADLELESDEFTIIADNREKFLKDYPDFDGKILDSTVKLSNSQDAVKLSFDRCQTWESEIAYEKSWGADGNGKTLEKIDFKKGNEKSNWQESYVLGGTPGKESSEKKAYSKKLKISELLPNPSGDEKLEEFIEIYNEDNEDLDLLGWRLEDKSGKFYALSSGKIEAKNYFVVYRLDFKFALNNTGSETVYLKDPNGDTVDKIAYSQSVKEDHAYALHDKEFAWTPFPTPGKENKFEELSTAENVFFTEILANPKEDEKSGEYLEIMNEESYPVDLYKWMIRDASKNGKYIFKNHLIVNPGERLAVYRSRFKIALNNSNESVYLFNPQGKLTSSVSYEKARENVSYNFDGREWRWSKFLTPGENNRLDSRPRVKIKRPKRAYKNTYTKFEVKAKDKETKDLKYVWEFGNGRKSYLQNTSHRYEKTGRYNVTLTVKDDSQSVEKNFLLRVRKHPRPKIEIVRIVPNPKGLDSAGETINVLNSSKKKIDFFDYKIATGSDTLVNHLVQNEIEIGPGEEKVITREDSLISLNNKAGKVAIIYPDGEIADEVEYSKDKIEDDEAYEKIDGEWRWISPLKPGENKEEVDAEEKGEVEGASTVKGNIFSITRPFALERASLFLSQLQTAEKQTTCREKPFENIYQLMLRKYSL